MASELIVAAVVVSREGCRPDGAVHALHLPVRPVMANLGWAMLGAIVAADAIEIVDRDVRPLFRLANRTPLSVKMVLILQGTHAIRSRGNAAAAAFVFLLDNRAYA